MFLSLQFPFADLRNFLENNGGRLESPKVSLPSKIGQDFIRSSGLIEYRRRGGVREHPGEEWYCDAKLALRFPDHLGEWKFGSHSVTGTVVNAFRRFYSIEEVARFEIALGLSVKYRDEASALEWLQLLQELLLIPMHKRNILQKGLPPDKTPTTVTLINAGNFLAQHYLAATTNRKIEPQVEPQRWWYYAGTPGLVVELEDWEPDWLPKALPHTRHVLDVPEASASLFHVFLKFNKKNQFSQGCDAWFIKYNKDNPDPDAARRLRISLGRLHAERECLNHVLNKIGPDPERKLGQELVRFDAIDQYLKDALASIQKTKRFGINQASMFEVAHSAFGKIFEGQEATYEKFGWQLAEKVKNYIRRAENRANVTVAIEGDVMITQITFGGNVSVNGDFTIATAKHIENSFNKAGTSEVNSELKEKLKELAVEVAKLASLLPPVEAENVSKDLETLTSEAVSKTPRKKFYELSADGIVGAAKAIGEMAVPVITAVNEVLKLLGL